MGWKLPTRNCRTPWLLNRGWSTYKSWEPILQVGDCDSHEIGAAKKYLSRGVSMDKWELVGTQYHGPWDVSSPNWVKIGRYHPWSLTCFTWRHTVLGKGDSELGNPSFSGSMLNFGGGTLLDSVILFRIVGPRTPNSTPLELSFNIKLPAPSRPRFRHVLLNSSEPTTQKKMEILQGSFP